MKIKEITLNQKELNSITDLAITKAQKDSIQREDKNFLTKCYIQAFIEYSNLKGYEIYKGKIVKAE